MNRNYAATAATVVLAVALGAGCAHQAVKRTSPLGAENAADESAGPKASSPAEVTNAEPNLRGHSMQRVPELRDVSFDFDSASLSSDARAVLGANAGWLKAHDDLRVQVTGNCDQRGTVEYNLALGQRRASAVREYYIHMGVPGARVATISYGKERLVCRQMNEACWRRNRRAATLVAAPESARR